MKWLIVTFAVLLAGCASTLTQVADKGAEGADNALNAAEWGICSAATIGALKRRYGLDMDKAKEYAEFCDIPVILIERESDGK